MYLGSTIIWVELYLCMHIFTMGCGWSDKHRSLWTTQNNWGSLRLAPITYMWQFRIEIEYDSVRNIKQLEAFMPFMALFPSLFAQTHKQARSSLLRTRTTLCLDLACRPVICWRCNNCTGSYTQRGGVWQCVTHHADSLWCYWSWMPSTKP